MLSRIAGACYRRRWTTLTTWLLGALLLAAVGGMAQPTFDKEYALPGTDSQRAYDVLATHFPDQSTGTGGIVLHARSGLDTPAARARVSKVLETAGALDPSIRKVHAPTDTTGGGRVSADGRTGVAPIVFTTPRTEVPKDAARKIKERLTALSDDTVRVELSGTMFAPVPSAGLSETAGLIAAVAILLVAFGSLVVAWLPIVSGLVALTASSGIVMLLAEVMAVPNFSMSVAMMIAIGVSVDYALFIVTRYRDARRLGDGPEYAIATAASTAGRAVVFAGVTVIASLAGMVFMDIPFIYGLAASCVLSVVVTLALAITLVPALLSLTDRWLTRQPGRRTEPSAPTSSGVSGRSDRRFLFTRRPAVVVAIGIVALLALSSPALSMRLGATDASNAPTSETTRRAHDLQQAAFGPGATAPLMIVADLEREGGEQLGDLARKLTVTEGVAQVSPPVISRDGRAAVITVVPRSDAQDQATTRLVRHLRDDVLPSAEGGEMRLHVGGQTATFQDLADRLGNRLLVFLLAVVVAALLTLALMFRSLVVAAQAVLMTLLSLGAAYGLLVAVFQWGWAKEPFGLATTGPLESYTPMTLLALLFGLSIDYQVFLLSRIREAQHRTGDTRTAITEGVRASRRVIITAALIMAFVFGCFTLSPDRIMKQFGLGLASAVLMGALAALTVTPALLRLLGHRGRRSPTPDRQHPAAPTTPPSSTRLRPGRP
ncbi:MMPL family transporter [Streptomyces buecherae]|uniref:MMPL family transporter n=1 Tax=Streptomyces buecherae TaxID=2763006 RepID=UPI0036B10DA4